MKQHLKIGTYIVLGVLVLGHSAHAQMEASSNVNANVRVEVDMKQRREDRQQKIEDRQEEREERQEERREYREEKRDDRKETIEARIRTHADWMTKRFNAAIVRLEKLGGRIDSRIAKIKAEGGNTSEAEASMKIARAEINEAKSGVLKIESELTLALSTTTLTKDSFKGLKALAETIKEDVRASHSAMTKAIKSLKPGLNIEASTTVKTVQ